MKEDNEQSLSRFRAVAEYRATERVRGDAARPNGDGAPANAPALSHHGAHPAASADDRTNDRADPDVNASAKPDADADADKRPNTYARANKLA